LENEKRKNDQKVADFEFYNKFIKPDMDNNGKKSDENLNWKTLRNFEQNISEIKKNIDENPVSPKFKNLNIFKTLKELESKVTELPEIKSPKRYGSCLALSPFGRTGDFNQRKQSCENIQERQNSRESIFSKKSQDSILTKNDRVTVYSKKSKVFGSKSPVIMRKKIVYLSK